VPSVTVSRMQADFGSRPGDLIVAIGPAIGACCYEVGEDVRAQFAQEGFGAAALGGWFRVHPLTLAGNPPVATLASSRRPGHWFFDGWSCARDQLQEAGVAREQIFIADLCTASHDSFCSYRRDGAVAGRMAGVIRPRP
jgi:hypothetical protein